MVLDSSGKTKPGFLLHFQAHRLRFRQVVEDADRHGCTTVGAGQVNDEEV